MVLVYLTLNVAQVQMVGYCNFIKSSQWTTFIGLDTKQSITALQKLTMPFGVVTSVGPLLQGSETRKNPVQDFTILNFSTIVIM